MDADVAFASKPLFQTVTSAVDCTTRDCKDMIKHVHVLTYEIAQEVNFPAADVSG